MAIEGNLDYALARVHARHGQRLDEAGWRRLETNRDLADWVSSFDLQNDCHTFERVLRARWRRYVETMASWHPLVWQAWLAWLAWLPGLSLLQQLARPDPAPTWMLADPMYGPIAPGTSTDRAAALAKTALAPLEPALAGRSSPGAAWCAHWDALRPLSEAHTQHSLELLLHEMQRHEEDLLRAPDTAEPARSELANRIQRLMRTAAGTVIVTVCHLALVARDLERLRGGLARRCLFGGQAEQA